MHFLQWALFCLLPLPAPPFGLPSQLAIAGTVRFLSQSLGLVHTTFSALQLWMVPTCPDNFQYENPSRFFSLPCGNNYKQGIAVLDYTQRGLNVFEFTVVHKKLILEQK